MDETDKYVDNERTMRVNATLMAMALPPRLRPLLATWRVTAAAGDGPARMPSGESPGKGAPPAAAPPF